MKGNNAWGGGTGYGSHILIHTGKGDEYKRDGIVVETMVHEAVHAVLDGAIYGDNAWYEAARKDGDYISTYARDNPDREDAAETILLYLAVEYKKDRLKISDYNTILNTIPNRIEYLNSQNYDVHPLKHESPTTSPTVAPTASSPTQSPNICEDSALRMIHNNKNRTCKWAGRKSNRCKNKSIQSHCPKTCKKCNKKACVDSTKKFKLKNRKGKCARVRTNIDMCNIEGVSSTCRRTCKFCF